MKQILWKGLCWALGHWDETPIMIGNFQNLWILFTLVILFLPSSLPSKDGKLDQNSSTSLPLQALLAVCPCLPLPYLHLQQYAS